MSTSRQRRHNIQLSGVHSKFPSASRAASTGRSSALPASGPINVGAKLALPKSDCIRASVWHWGTAICINNVPRASIIFPAAPLADQGGRCPKRRPRRLRHGFREGAEAVPRRRACLPPSRAAVSLRHPDAPARDADRPARPVAVARLPARGASQRDVAAGRAADAGPTRGEGGARAGVGAAGAYAAAGHDGRRGAARGRGRPEVTRGRLILESRGGAGCFAQGGGERPGASVPSPKCVYYINAGAGRRPLQTSPSSRAAGCARWRGLVSKIFDSRSLGWKEIMITGAGERSWLALPVAIGGSLDGGVCVCSGGLGLSQEAVTSRCELMCAATPAESELCACG